MLTRVALLAASLATSAVLALGLAIAGVGSARPAATSPQVTPAAASAPDAPPQPVTQVDTVYVVPSAAAGPNPTPAPTPSPIVVKRVVVTPAGGGEGGDND